MGSNVSKTTTELANKVITDQSTSIMRSTQMYTDQNLTAEQIMDVNLVIKGSVRNCSLQFKQNMKVENRVYSSIDESEQLDLIKTVKKNLDSTLKSETKQKLKALNIGQVNYQRTSTMVDNYSFDDLSTAIVSTLSNEVNSAVRASQNMPIVIVVEGDFICDKNNNQQLFTQNLDMTSIVENTVKSERVQNLVNDFVAEVKTVSESKSGQVAEGIDPFVIIMIIGIIIGVVLLIAGGIVLAKKNINKRK